MIQPFQSQCQAPWETSSVVTSSSHQLIRATSLVERDKSRLHLITLQSTLSSESLLQCLTVFSRCGSQPSSAASEDLSDSNCKAWVLQRKLFCYHEIQVLLKKVLSAARQPDLEGLRLSLWVQKEGMMWVAFVQPRKQRFMFPFPNIESHLKLLECAADIQFLEFMRSRHAHGHGSFKTC